MHRKARYGILVLGVLFLLDPVASRLLAGEAVPARSPRVSFNRDVRPILADKCFACHGPDEGPREAELRLDVRDDAVVDRGGYKVIAAGKADESELISRIVSEDEFERMPPDSTGKSLSKQDIETLRRWIREGAEFEEHWSLIPPRRGSIPQVPDPAWPRNEIDRFIAAKHAERKLTPSPDADARTLLRRLSFDLIGLPPTSEEVEAFTSDTSPGAYEAAVDRLLASKHFGERMAIYWLDVVRYADTGGYHSDNHRDVAPYRDYVINAFNDNLPFDQFTVEQLAGDLLPDATTSQKIASGYNRLLQTTEEGGAQPKEYTAKYQADRVRNTAAAWLGITMGCCECHNHKFDPYTLKDFYSFAAFFADIQEKAVGRQAQIAVPNAGQQEQLANLQETLAPLRNDFERQSPERDAAVARWADEQKAKRDDASTKETSSDQKKKSELPKEVVEALAKEPGSRNAAQRDTLAKHYRSIAPERASQREKIQQIEQEIEQLRKTIPQTLVSVSGPPRTVRILARGNWLDDSGEVVGPATPTGLPAASIDDRARARLDLAHWMVSKQNPLVARVFVNRLWNQVFGQGIVRSLNDFGTQGQWPSHPDLLDWLAVEFQESGWDVKHMIKTMVMSRTYQQSSITVPGLDEKDPNSQWLARQARFRLDAEIIRDNALAISGLLSPEIGGRSVKPYQPAGYWRHLNFPKRTWKHDQGPDLYRRGLYTYWQRTFLHPSLSAFDAPSREECTVQRPRSNTPLQALVLLNDPTYVEAARVFATRIMEKGGESDEQRLDFAFRRALNRSPKPNERDVLSRLLAQHQQQYRETPDDANALLQYGESKVPKPSAAQDLAAWTSVARVILNLHETITRY